MRDSTQAPRTLSVPGQPTDALPGTEAKVLVMVERAGRREPLFHPDDGRLPRRRQQLPVLQGEGEQRSESA